MKQAFKAGALITQLILMFGSLGLVGCSTPQPRTETYKVAFRQSPPQPVYNRLRWVRPPDVKPARGLPQAEAPRINPIFHLAIDNGTLEEVSLALAAMARYQSYCSSLVAEKRISIQSLGTLDELADEVATLSGVHVVVDHPSREIRFLAQNYNAPQFYEEGFEHYDNRNQ